MPNELLTDSLEKFYAPHYPIVVSRSNDGRLPVEKFESSSQMAVTLIFVAICMDSIVFMVRFLIAICGRDGKAIALGHMVRVVPEPDGGNGGDTERQPRRVPRTSSWEVVPIGAAHPNTSTRLTRPADRYPHVELRGNTCIRSTAMTYGFEIARAVSGVGFLAHLVRLGWKELGEIENLKK